MFEKALRLNKKNETAKAELDLVKNLMHFDEILPTDASLRLSKTAFAQALGLGEAANNSDSDPNTGGSDYSDRWCAIF